MYWLGLCYWVGAWAIQLRRRLTAPPLPIPMRRNPTHRWIRKIQTIPVVKRAVRVAVVSLPCSPKTQWFEPNPQAPALHQIVEDVATQHGRKFGQLAQPLRVALCGSAVSPAIDVTLTLIGRGRVLGRLERAVQWLQGQAPA